MYRSDDSYPVAVDLGLMSVPEADPEPSGGDIEPPAVVVAVGQADSVAIVLSSPNAFLVTPPTLPVAVKFWPLVMVNLPTAGVDYHVPFGGRKGSSYGPREQGRYAVEFYTTVKTAYTLP